MASILELRAVKAFYGPSEVVHGIDVAVEEGGMTVLLGANGAGKTTTLRAICGMVRTEGDILFAGQRLDHRSTEQIAAVGVAHVPEGRGTFIGLTVEENLRLGGYTRARRIPANIERMYGYFPILAQRRRQQGGALSGGEQQMLAIARALMGRPRLLLLDEPSLGLAPLLVKQIFAAIRDLNRKDKLTVFLVEQNAFHALKLADRGYVMVNGLITLTGTGRELLRRPEVRSAYLEGGASKAG